ncbi:MAG: Gfo/Idh/MocA family oxidoreductase [Planctomycetota bacterium]|nr:Gfo/Idh/MocA family oxidoreductase [Planctomycetota bacterium]
MSAKKTLRMGLLGCGGIANRHAKTLVQIPEYELVAWCDVVRPNAERFQQEYGKGEVFTDYHEMFAKSDLDVVTICMPPFAHDDEVEVAAKAGAHILIEKPISLTNAQAQRMVKAVETHKVKTQVGFMSRFLGGVERIRELLASGKGPGIQYVGRYFCNSLHSPWWRMKDKSGGQLVEQIIHQVDLCRFLMGKPRQVFAYTGNLAHKDVENYTVEDVSGTVIRFESGGIGVISGTNCAIPGKWLAPSTFVAKGLVADWGPGANTITVTDGKEPVTEPFEGGNDTNLAQHLDLLKAIREEGATRTPMSEGAATQALVVAAYQSAETGKPVDL